MRSDGCYYAVLRRQLIEDSAETVYIQRGGTSIAESPSFRDRRAVEWRIETFDKSFDIVIDHVELFVAERRKFSNIIALIPLCAVSVIFDVLESVIKNQFRFLHAFIVALCVLLYK